MKNLYLTIIFIHCFFISYTQNENRYWYFGNNIGIDFGSTLNTPTMLFGTPNKSNEGVASISDRFGNFILYTNGIEIRSGANLSTQNTNSLTGDQSSSQSGIIIPSPCNCSDFIVFSIDQWDQNNNPDPINYLVASTAGTNVTTVSSATPLTSSISYEKITAVPHANGNDYWILSPIPLTSNFIVQRLSCENNSIKFTPFNGNGVQQVAGINNFDNNKSNGYLKASHDFNYLALAEMGRGEIEVFNFNNATGLITSLRTITTTNPYGIEFSLDNTKVYWSNPGRNNTTNAQIGECSFLNNSIATFFQVPNSNNPAWAENEETTWYEAGALQISPNRNKIYVALPGYNSLGSFSSNSAIMINSPGNFIVNDIDFGNGNNVRLGLPNNPRLNVCPDVITSKKCECKTPLNIFGEEDPLSVQNIILSDTNLSFAEETFTVNTDAIIPITELKVNITDIQFEYNYDKCADCNNNPALWGSIYSNNDYIGTNLTGLKQPNTLNSSNFDILTQIGNDVDNNINNREIIWNNPNGSMIKNGDKFKLFYLLPPTSEIPCCATKAKICIKISWKDANCNVCEEYTCTNIDLSEKISSLKLSQKKIDCCSTKLTAETDKPASFKWNTGETSEEITVTQNGTYTVTATIGNSSMTQTIIISNIVSGPFPLLTHPSKIFPTGSSGNDKLYISNPSLSYNVANAYNATKYKLWIFNRWGELIREIEGENCNGFPNFSIYWDGKDRYGNFVQQDDYNWRFFVQNCSHNEDTQIVFNTVEVYCKRRLFGTCVSKDRRAVTKLLTHGEVTVVR